MLMLLAQKFLSYRGNPLVKFYAPEKEVVEETKIIKDRSYKYRELETMMEINETMPYPIQFLPNGNYGEKNMHGVKITCAIGKSMEGSMPYWHGFFVDVDLKKNRDQLSKTYASRDLYIERYMHAFKQSGITPSFMARTPGGLHFYFLLEPRHKDKIIRKYTDAEMGLLGGYIGSWFDGSDASKGAKLNDPIRLPFTKHWKDEPTIVELYQFIGFTGKLELKQIQVLTDFDDEHLMTLDIFKLDNFFNQIKREKQIDKEVKVFTKGFEPGELKSCAEIPFRTLIKALEEYPKQYAGKNYTFFFEGYNLHVKYDDGTIDYTSGYKLNAVGNYMNCFSAIYHPIEERPRGGVFAFIYNYFDKNPIPVKAFFKKHFDLDLLRNESVAGKDILRQVEGVDFSIYCTWNGVYLSRYVQNKAGIMVPISKTIFREPFKVIGKALTTYKEGFGETDQPQMAFLLERYRTGDRVLVRACSNKHEWNEQMLQHQLFFFGIDDELGLLYKGIFDDQGIPVYDINYLNGYYKEFVMFGGEHIKMVTDEEKLHNLDSPAFPFTTLDKEQVSVKDYLAALCEVFDEEVAVPAFLQMLVLMGMNARNGVEELIIRPGLFLTGETKSGKSSLLELLKICCGFHKKARQVSANAVTSQPFKVDATDNSPMFLEEFTGENINPKVQGDMRNVLNRETGKKGNLHTNIVYKFKSPLFILGERLPDFESLTNRFVVLAMDVRYHKGTKSKLIALQNFGCLDEILKIRWNLFNTPGKGGIGDLYVKHVEMLQHNGIGARYAEARAFIFIANDIFDLEIDKEDLLKYTKANLRNVGYYGDGNAEVGPMAKFENFFMQAHIKRRIQVTRINGQHGYTIKMFLDSEYVNRNKSEISKIVNDLNNRLTEFIHKSPASRAKYLTFSQPYITMDKGIISFTVPNTECSPLQQELDAFNTNFLTMLGSHGYSSTSSESDYGIGKSIHASVRGE